MKDDDIQNFTVATDTGIPDDLLPGCTCTRRRCYGRRYVCDQNRLSESALRFSAGRGLYRHFTTIAHFVSTLSDDIATIFGAVLAICQREGLIGGELFAIDGVKLPSNASKHKNGTRSEFERQAAKLAATAKTLLARTLC